MKRIDEFRIFYNHTIYPELMRMELKRKRLLRLIIISSILLVGLLLLEFYLNILAITLIGGLVIAFYISWLIYQTQKFRQTFKPNIVRLILDFLDDSLNYGNFIYSEKKLLPKERFVASRLFGINPHFYKGEDYIQGSIGSISFELCEILVQHLSAVNGRLRSVFKGIFLYSELNHDKTGEVFILPHHQKQFHGHAINTIIDAGGRNIDQMLYDAPFREVFTVYATQFTNVKDFLPDEIQQLISSYYEKHKQDIFISFIDNQLFVFLTEPNDFLEPYLFKSNVKFELIKDFFEDIQLIMTVVEDFDRIY